MSKLSTYQRTRQLTIFALLGAVMFCSKVLMEWAPNIHLLGMLTGIHADLQKKSADSHLCICAFAGGICGLRIVVDSLHLHLDYFMGHHNDFAQKYACKNCSARLYGRLRSSWALFWNTLCTSASYHVWSQLERHDCLDYCRLAL